MTQAGGKLKVELVEKFGLYALENNLKFYVMYGATEASARMSYLKHSKIITKQGSIGKAIKNGRFEIDQESSELIYEGPNVFGGYANDFLDLSTYDSSNVLKTGDIARKDAGGYYYIVGRIKRFVKISGQRVNLDEVEELIFSLREISVKCIGLNDKLLIVFYIANELDINNLKKEVIGELKIHHSFIQFKKVSDFPLTPNGKIDYKKLEAYL
jgi:acyl-coenzyme A synthetase/AMP-(fatty) acid ligase